MLTIGAIQLALDDLGHASPSLVGSSFTLPQSFQQQNRIDKHPFLSHLQFNSTNISRMPILGL